MRTRVIVGFLAAALLVVSQAAAQGGARNVSQQQGRGPAGPPPQGRGRGVGGAGPREAEVRQALIQRMQRVLQLPDSQLTKLTAVTFRFRDSTLLLEERERFVREQLFREGRGEANQVVNEGRVSCLLDALFNVQQMRLNTRIAEDAEVKTFLPPLQRLQYFSIQENFYALIDQTLDRQNQRLGRDSLSPPGGRMGGGGGGGGGARGAGVGGGGRGGVAGRQGPPPGGARPGGPPGGARGPLAALCPPARGR